MCTKTTKLIITLLIFATAYVPAMGAELDIDYPRTANYFLDGQLHPDEGRLLAKWDVLVLSPGAQEWRPDVFQVIRELNPDVILLAYVSVSGVSDHPSRYENFSSKDADNLPDEWWLRSSQNEKLSYWPGAHRLNVTDLSPVDSRGLRWNDWLADWIVENIYSSGYWDGIFLDEAFPAMSWLNGGDIDLDGDGQIDDKEAIDIAWQAGTEKIIKNLRNHVGSDGYIVVNGASNYTTYTNGRMQENAFKKGSSWTREMNTYLNTSTTSGYSPKLALINSNTGNTGIIDSQKKLFGLTSTLLGNGFYSYDHGDQKHFNIWWSDSYEKTLGQPLGKAKNITGANDQGFIPGLWRRDFTHGVVLVNSTDKPLSYNITLQNKFTSGALDPFSGSIISINEFELSSSNQVEPNLDPTVVPDTSDPVETEVLPNTDTQPLYEDKPVLINPTTTLSGDELEIEVLDEDGKVITGNDNPGSFSDWFQSITPWVKNVFKSITSFFGKFLI